MSTSFFLHNDGYITISNGTDTLQITLTEFLTYEPAYTLPSPYISRYYVPTVKDELHTANSQAAGPLPWTAGDGYIANLATYINSHNNPVLTLNEAKAAKYVAIDAIATTTKLGGVLLFATTMPSSAIDANSLLSYENLTATPMGFYLNDINLSPVSLSLSQLNTYNNGVVQLWLLCKQNADTLKAAVAALNTVNAVNAYNINTGWPTVPYTPV